MIQALFYATLFFPLVGALAIAVLGQSSEPRTASMARTIAALSFASSFSLLVAWISGGARPILAHLGGLGLGGARSLPLSVLLDSTTAVFLFVTALAMVLVVRYSVVYLHREPGFTRFFATIFAFLFGMHLLLLAGSLDLLFAGWEVVGIASFLLIGFYGDRELPVRASLRAYAVYRFCDLGLLLGVCITHFIWRQGLAFQDMAQENTHLSPLLLAGFGLLMLMAACGKSAQFPFSFWLPRAMEGPTPSSAIFYGALSVHAGVFLLLRTSPLWESSLLVRCAIGGTGSLSALVATTSGRMQSNIKGQIAYASITQVGLMLVEIALGLRELVLLHFAGNAFLRCFQLLVSPSILANMLRLQPGPRTQKIKKGIVLPPRIIASLHALAFNEWYLEAAIRAFLLRPLRVTGLLLGKAGTAITAAGAVLTGVVLCVLLFQLPVPILPIGFSIGIAVCMLLAAFRALVATHAPESAWHAASVSCFLGGIAVLAASGMGSSHDVSFYFWGTIPAWALGFAVIRARSTHGGRLILSETQAGVLLLLAFLALSGFPIGPAFIGEDHLLHRSAEHDQWLTVMLAVAFVMNGFTLASVYSQVARGTRTGLVNMSFFEQELTKPNIKKASAAQRDGILILERNG